MAIKNDYLPSDIIDDYNALMYIIKKSIFNTVNTIELVRVLEVREGGKLVVIPVVQDINTSGEPIEESPIYNVRIFRNQAGLNAIKLDPKVGDIGLLLISKRDISNAEGGVVETTRKFNACDGIYLGGVYGLNQEPTQFIEIKENELNITGTQTINITAPTVNIKGSTAIKLGENAIQGVAIQGMKVTNNGQPSGTTVGFIAEGSAIVKAL